MRARRGGAALRPLLGVAVLGPRGRRAPREAKPSCLARRRRACVNREAGCQAPTNDR